PASTEFQDYIGSNWADRVDELPEPREQAPFAASRRALVSQAFIGQRLFVPAGSLKQRSNYTDYPFRAHSAFAHLTGGGADSEPDSVL
ncbi:aminopeptidase P N-terminal domain-containing protein, partial [Escherichia coli]|uniref:aminopeptidase P N-terminal domain-containing protein n=1 Tax=Escherichia coli TaxID=562 RepID=UPI00196446CF